MPNTTRGQGKETLAILSAGAFLVVGVLVVWFAKSVVHIDGDLVYVSFMLVPILVYAVASGRLQELKGPGGLEARFVEAAEQTVTAGTETVAVSVQDVQVVVKEGQRALQQRAQALDDSRPIVMQLALGKSGSAYDWNAVKQYMEVLSQHRTFGFVVFVDADDRFVGYMAQATFKGLLGLPELGDEFINVLNQGRLGDLYRYPGFIRDAVSIRSTNVEALREMTKQNLDAVVVIDAERRLKGIVEREQTLSRMMLALVR